MRLAATITVLFYSLIYTGKTREYFYSTWGIHCHWRSQKFWM